MEEIPEDVMKRIDAAVEKYGNQPVVTGIKMAMADVLNELVAEERERCARIVERNELYFVFRSEPTSTQQAVQKAYAPGAEKIIAEVIREGHP